MLPRFKQYSDEQHLLPAGREVLLAVSGGRDSVALVHLMHAMGQPFAMAHCNFHLRGDESDRDQRFVQRLADRMGATLHVADFDTHSYAAAHAESVEEAARHLRYCWFARLCATHGYPCLATAHHADDAVETFFLNLLRGTGIDGLHGIRPRTTLSVDGLDLHVVRPMLCFSRADIDDYVERQGLDYVDDSTNFETDARRNRLRLQVLPLLRQMNPSFTGTMMATMQRLADTGTLFRERIGQLADACVAPCPSRLPGVDDRFVSVQLDAVERHESCRTLLFELLRPYGFDADAVDSMLRRPHRTGALFLSPTHESVIHASRLVVGPRTPMAALHLTQQPFSPQEGYWRALEGLGTRVAVVDAAAVRQPLRLRPWQPADRFKPFGMDRWRLVSDFLKDQKLHRLEKKCVQLVVDADDRVVWVAGLRADNRFRLTNKSLQGTLLNVTPAVSTGI